MSRLQSRFFILALVVLLTIGLGACEPFTPDSDQQAVIVITATATMPLPPSPTPPLTTSLPTRPVPTATETPFIPVVPTVEICDEITGRIINASFTSALVGGEENYRVYLPPCFFQTLRRYPYVILLHGSGYDYTQWTDDIGVQDVLDARIGAKSDPLPPMVVVMPEGGDLQEFNYFEEGASFEDMLLTELIPEIERQFCVWNSPEGRAIGGISRGGFWAVSIALRYPELFEAVGGHSPFFVTDNAPVTHNPLDLAYTIDASTAPRIYLDNARSDSGGDNVIRLSNTLRAGNVTHTYEIAATGGHDNDYWKEHTPDYLAFYGRDWPVEADLLPSCFE